jgi:hypothetical protein
MKKFTTVIISIIILFSVGCGTHIIRLQYSKTYPATQNESVWSRINSYVYNNHIPVVSENSYVIKTNEYVISREVSATNVKIIISGFGEYNHFGFLGEPEPHSLQVLKNKKMSMIDLMNYAETGVSIIMIDRDIPPNIQRFMR